MQPLVPLVFHNLPSLYPPSFRRNDFYTCISIATQAEEQFQSLLLKTDKEQFVNTFSMQSCTGGRFNTVFHSYNEAL